ncbi:MAG: YfcE family phosphodiesterase [Phycisphaerae bacterium]|nr:YfcE family phosphodiesterase [Phycisphaerae bacterium]
MRIGILSDSHGRSDRLHRAVELLEADGAEAIVHCGDIISVDDAKYLAGFDGPAYLVAGNMDHRREGKLQAAIADRGLCFATDFIAVPLGDGQHLAATHGHHEMLLDELIHGGQFRYVCHGHSHSRRDERFGPTRVLNPGALNHPRGTKNHTVLLLDTDTDTVREIIV